MPLANPRFREVKMLPKAIVMVVIAIVVVGGALLHF